jgi:hypothetical protein
MRAASVTPGKKNVRRPKMIAAAPRIARVHQLRANAAMSMNVPLATRVDRALVENAWLCNPCARK